MKYLFIARHGSYGNDNRLNDHGHKQMEVLGGSIKEILNGASAYILSSTAPRAIDSAEVLAVQLELPKEFEKTEDLWTGGDSSKERAYYCDCDKLIQMINERREKADGLVMMTHLEVGEDFPSYFLKQEFEQNEYIRDISKGQAVHINLEDKTHQLLPK